MMKKIYRKLGWLLAVVCMLAGCGSVTEPGISYLKHKNDENIHQLSQKISYTLFQDQVEKYQNGEAGLASVFSGSLILGDSRAVGLYQYNVLPEEEVQAEIGISSWRLDDEDFVEAVIQKQPSCIIWAFGLNDMCWRMQYLEEGYAAVIEELMDPIVQGCPDSLIFLSSILPASQAKQEEVPEYADVDAMNAALLQLCQEKGWYYIDNSSLPFEENYQADGEHFSQYLLELWAENMADALIQVRSRLQV